MCRTRGSIIWINIVWLNFLSYTTMLGIGVSRSLYQIRIVNIIIYQIDIHTPQSYPDVDTNDVS